MFEPTMSWHGAHGLQFICTSLKVPSCQHLGGGDWSYRPWRSSNFDIDQLVCQAVPLQPLQGGPWPRHPLEVRDRPPLKSLFSNFLIFLNRHPKAWGDIMLHFYKTAPSLLSLHVHPTTCLASVKVPSGVQVYPWCPRGPEVLVQEVGGVTVT